jgi:hypothetical protein
VCESDGKALLWRTVDGRSPYGSIVDELTSGAETAWAKLSFLVLGFYHWHY